MKNRIKALLLASSLCVASLSLGGSVYAESSTEGVVEQITEAADADASSEGEGQFAQYYDQMKASVAATLEQLSAMTDEQLADLVDGTDANNASIAAAWMGVKEELGVFTGMQEQEVVEGDNTVTVNSVATYDGVSENTKVNVSYVYDFKKGNVALDWDIKYPMSKLIREAGLNTLLGLGTVFIVLIFLSFVIGNIHWIPDLVEKFSKKNAPIPTPAPSPASAPVAAAAEAEVELADDEELVAIIAAAIAAYERTSTDGFVVRSIRKANRRRY